MIEIDQRPSIPTCTPQELDPSPDAGRVFRPPGRGDMILGRCAYREPVLVVWLKLGIAVSQATVAKYKPRRRRPPSQTWRTFLKNHAGQIVAADFFVVPTATYRLVFVLVLLAHERRRVVHFAVTSHPTAEWTRQQLREAFPWAHAPRNVLHDRDHAFAAWAAAIRRRGYFSAGANPSNTSARSRGRPEPPSPCTRDSWSPSRSSPLSPRSSRSPGSGTSCRPHPPGYDR